MRWHRWMFLGLMVSAAGLGAWAQPASLEVQKLELAIKESKLELATRITALEHQRNLLFGVLGVSVAALPLALWRFFRQADMLAEERLKEVFESRPRMLMEILDEHDAERRLRRETRITVVSDAMSLEGVLRQHGFRNVVTRKKSELDNALAESAVVLDLVQGVEVGEATEILATYNLEHALVFSHERVDLPPGRATFANSHMTLFSRLLELLKFQDAAARG